MIDFDFEKMFPQDFQVPLNIAALDERFDRVENERFKLLEEHFSLFSEAYLHAGDIIFKDYMEFLSNPKKRNEYSVYEDMFGVILRLYFHAIEMKCKSLMFRANIEPEKEHTFSEFLKKLEQYYEVPENAKSYFEYMKKLDKYSNGSQTGRYPTDTKGNIIGKLGEKCVFIGGEQTGGIATMVFYIHEVFTEIFPNLKIKKGGN